MSLKFTPENITELGPDEVFVFGSNLAGMHGGGAARVAFQRFGAKLGQGVGIQGQSYAIPTMQGGVDTIKPYVDEFIEFAGGCDQTTFWVTRIGCGIAGFKDEEIAPLFAEALGFYNVRLPESFAKVITGMEYSYLSDWVSGYTSYDMMEDLLLGANRIFRYGKDDAEKALDRLRGELRGSINAIRFVCDLNRFDHLGEHPNCEWIDEQLKRGAAEMEIEGLLKRPVQRFGLVFEADIARLLVNAGGDEVLGQMEKEMRGDSVRRAMSGLWDRDSRVVERMMKAFEPVEERLTREWGALCVGDRLDESRVVELLEDPQLREEWRKIVDRAEILKECIERVTEREK